MAFLAKAVAYREWGVPGGGAYTVGLGDCIMIWWFLIGLENTDFGLKAAVSLNKLIVTAECRRRCHATALIFVSRVSA